jgi:SAM (Sterile alpha motif) domain-containing protein
MDVVVWLRGLGLGKYEAAFRENEIDETVLPRLGLRPVQVLVSEQEIDFLLARSGRTESQAAVPGARSHAPACRCAFHESGHKLAGCQAGHFVCSCAFKARGSRQARCKFWQEGCAAWQEISHIA